MAANHLSNNANNLDPYVKKRYYEKISSVGIGPILIPGKAYDPDCLPRVESLDFHLVISSAWYKLLRQGSKLFGACKRIISPFQGFWAVWKGTK